MKKISLVAFLVVALATVFYACSKSDGGDDGPGTGQGFDKSAMLASYADNLIIPGYTALQQQLANLKTASDAFLAAPSEGTRATLKQAYTAAHLQYERVAAFQFGPAESALLDLFVNFSGGLDYNFNTSGELTGFSVDSNKIEQNITAGGYTFTNMVRSSFYSQGFPALNYLYFGPNAIDKLNADPVKRKQYINDVLARFKALVDKVAGDWPAYRAGFIANTKTDVGSPIGSMINQFAYQMDLLKGPRIGWPFGKQSNGIVFASKTEAYFAGISGALAVENITSLKKIYTNNGNGKGMSDYLVALGKQSLNTDVLAQFDLVIARLQAIPDPLSASLTGNAAAVEAAYKEIQKLLTLLKTDVPSATGVQITFMDNDGD
ncbi:imelysin family protein [Chitinophaga barathri]|uniref:Imelysin-like domain-containing protein n=1 Tax=Chitinophaga barathri TaxID=1647451 RepID=A0A3N4MHD8_9BACT|nr:imelysin family protein [Chitinophaga barathri]RPD41167.1 hypothetical protein EG028_10810 [Chitinophaga barathri]